MANWDLLISGLVIAAIILIVFARVSGQTITEFLRDMREFLTEKGEEQTENYTQIYD